MLAVLVCFISEASSAVASPDRIHLPPVNLFSIHMVTARVGWGNDQTRILHTDDSGRAWRDVSPPMPWEKRLSSGFLPLDGVDARTAWLVAPEAVHQTLHAKLTFQPASPSGAIIFHTTDAGKSWKRLPTLMLGRFYYVRTIQFIDPEHGWLLVIRDVAMMRASFDIYRTSDGGRDWTRVFWVSPFRQGKRGESAGGGLPGCDCGQNYTYVAPKNGWVGGCYCGLGSETQLFFHTADGRSTWRRYHLLLPMHSVFASIEAPVFFTPRLAVLPLYFYPGHGATFFDAYHTSDAGRHWQATEPIRVHSDAYLGGFVDPMHGFLLDQRRLNRTSDGGRHWLSFPSALSQVQVSDLDFVTARVGFAIEGIGTSERTRLLETTDAGLTWKRVQAELLPRD